MAEQLTEAQKAKTRQYLGYFNLQNRSVLSAGQPIVTFQSGVLEKNMDSILNEFALEAISELIEDIDCSRKNIREARKRLKVKSVAYSVEYNPYEISTLWQEDFKLCAQLAHLLVVPLVYHPSGRGSNGMGGVIQIRGCE